jgi:hypothetical protein
MDEKNENIYTTRTDGLPTCVDCSFYSYYMKCAFNLINSSFPISCNKYIARGTE